MKIYMCYDCRQGFDIEISGGIACPECGGKRWKRINKLPSSAEEYRKKWAEEYDVMICDNDHDMTTRKILWFGEQTMKGVEGERERDV